MQIKQQMLAQQIQKKIAPLYVLIGQEHYLLEESLDTIKSAIKKSYDYDEKVISVQSTEDWTTVLEEANSYSLFSDTVLLNIFYDKKSIDATGKKILTEYLKVINSRCFIIIRAPNIPAKQLQWLYNSEHVVLVVAYPLNTELMKQWIANQFKKNALTVEQQIPDLIYQYTQGNMLACAQVIEKIALSNASNRQINSQLALEHLSDQCAHSLFELVEACLMGQADKAIHILRQAANNKTEVTLVLWILTQEIRVLLQLSFAIQQNTDFKAACNQLKIWPQRINLYQSSIKRLTNALLEQLLYFCKSIDEQIKSNLNTQVWNALERLTLSLCIGTVCVV
ncbi:DNA polymerase III subunit delta [Legionella maioricensis]|uniref:DNA polymerase III subunit delta n=1 Tax=Legionella maioricensis TaxID=2896528 RepID=A0A9X2D2S7_9GAMM|nr:DNA polymerase III subunit delta [Legionella maioricensis]MCL9684627.1 DNA polymerase III subunit delta [Legionella maioricensis]MCL9687407.1 DNA polymerase III subunit delta [Legionella maioricensis]